MKKFLKERNLVLLATREETSTTETKEHEETFSSSSQLGTEPLALAPERGRAEVLQELQEVETGAGRWLWHVDCVRQLRCTHLALGLILGHLGHWSPFDDEL